MKLRVKVPELLQVLGIDARRRGNEMWARCPLPNHVDRDPSWQMRDELDADEHGLWRCFGCGERGNAVHLVAQVLGLPYREARVWLETTGLGGMPPVPPRVVVDVLPSHSPVFSMPVGVVFAPMGQWPEHVHAYMLRVKSLAGLEPWQVLRWGIGYGTLGKLSGRVVIPVVDFHGKLCGYTARTFVDEGTRYIEARPDDGADIAAVFGEQHWPEIAQRSLLVVTEGALNALAVERALRLCDGEMDGHEVYLAAVRGSELSPTRASRIATFARVLVASDPDDAGAKLFGQIRASCGRWCCVSRLGFPGSKDAADLPVNELAQLLVSGIVGG